MQLCKLCMQRVLHSDIRVGRRGEEQVLLAIHSKSSFLSNYIGIMEKKMETTIVYRGLYIRIMENANYHSI